MGLKPDPSNYPEGVKDKEYKKQVADMQQNPHKWNLPEAGYVPDVATTHRKADEKAIVKEAEVIKNRDAGGKLPVTD